MKIEEAIKHCEEVAEELEKKANTYGIKQSYIPKSREAVDCLQCAEDHKQLATWLTELKERREADNWISVEKELPPLEVNSRDYTITVLVLKSNGECDVCYYCYDDYVSYWTTEDGRREYDEEDITHWQPLPKPPKE